MNSTPGAITFIAVDDDILDLLAITELAKGYPFLQHCGSYQNAADALVAFNNINPDVVFLDVEMPGINGFDFLKTVKSKIPVSVFITSHPEFALTGFELSAIDYIVKPLTEERFAETVRRIREYLDIKRKAAAYSVLFEQETLTFKEGHNKVKIPQQDIVYLEAMQDYTKIITPHKIYMALSPLSNFLDNLPQNRFMRVHRSYAVSIKKIKELRYNELVCDDVTIPIGKTYRSAVAQIKL